MASPILRKMIIQIVKFKTELSEEELLKIAEERLPGFKALPGLLQKYYVKLDQPGQYGGIYVWDSPASLKSYRESDLAATIPQAYQVIDTPDIEILDVLFPLRI